jgi:hypothetical protein
MESTCNAHLTLVADPPPIRQLLAFKRVTLQEGETLNVTLCIPRKGIEVSRRRVFHAGAPSGVPS